MPPEFLFRLVITLLVFLIATLSYRWYWYQVAAQSKERVISSGKNPTILFFSSPDCVVCHTVQTPALAVVAKRMTDQLNIIEVDTNLETELAKDWKVLSVPTLIGLNAEGNLVFIKHGARRADELLVDIQSLYSS